MDEELALYSPFMKLLLTNKYMSENLALRYLKVLGKKQTVGVGGLSLQRNQNVFVLVPQW